MHYVFLIFVHLPVICAFALSFPHICGVVFYQTFDSSGSWDKGELVRSMPR